MIYACDTLVHQDAIVVIITAQTCNGKRAALFSFDVRNAFCAIEAGAYKEAKSFCALISCVSHSVANAFIDFPWQVLACICEWILRWHVENN